MRKIVHQNVYSASFLASSNAPDKVPELIFTPDTSNDAVPHNNVTFRGLKQKFNMYTL